MHLYKILLAFTLLIVSTVAQLQFSQFPPPSVRVGQPVTVTWIGGNGGPVTITLKKGPSDNLKTVVVLTTSATGGLFTFVLDVTIVSGPDYTLEISQGSEINYTGQFAVVGSAGVSSGTSSTTITGSSTVSSLTSITSVAKSSGTGSSSSSESLSSATSSASSTGTPHSATLSSKDKILIGVLVPVVVAVVAIVIFFLWRRRLRNAGERFELEVGHGATINELETRESKRQEMEQPAPKLAGVPKTNGAISELATENPDHTTRVQGHEATPGATSAIPAAQHGLGNDDQPQELETKSPSNPTHVLSENKPTPPEGQQHTSDTQEQQSERSPPMTTGTVNQSSDSVDVEQLRAEEARLNARIAQLQDLMQLDQERQRVREKIQGIEAEKRSP